MSTANFFFHGLFPDYIETKQDQSRQICKVLFDVDVDGKFYSHLIANIWQVDEVDGVPTFEVEFDIPFECDEFPRAVVKYYQQVIGPQSKTISQSGPKGPIPNKNVYRVQWQISLPAIKKRTN